MLLSFIKLLNYIFFVFFFLLSVVKGEIRFLPYISAEHGIISTNNLFLNTQSNDKFFFLKPTTGLKMNELFFLEVGYYYVYNVNNNILKSKYFFFDLGITKPILTTTDFFCTLGCLLNNSSKHLNKYYSRSKLTYNFGLGVNHLCNKHMDLRACLRLYQGQEKSTPVFSVGGIFYI